MRGYLGVICLGLSVLAGSACSAATIQPIKGDVSINHGQGFQKVDGATEAGEGDIVMVSPEGSAVVSYADGCKISLQPGMVMTIAPLSPCAAGSYAQDDQNHDNRAWGYLFGAGAAAALGVGIYEATRTSQAAAPTPASP